jgi:hypothetical protein
MSYSPSGTRQVHLMFEAVGCALSKPVKPIWTLYPFSNAEWVITRNIYIQFILGNKMHMMAMHAPPVRIFLPCYALEIVVVGRRSSIRQGRLR